MKKTKKDNFAKKNLTNIVSQENGVSLEKARNSKEVDYIDFPKFEYEAYRQRLNKNRIIYTTRVSSEVGKYKIHQIYNSCFGKLKVIYFKHFVDIEKHPFYNELNEQQLNEINLYIKENGYDLIGLGKIK